MAQLNDNQRLAMLLALQKGIKAEIDALRPICDEELISKCKADGTEKLVIRYGDTDLATYTVVYDKTKYTINDREAYEEWLLESNLAFEYQPPTELKINPKWEQRVSVVRGEVVDNVTGEELFFLEPARKRIKQTRITGTDPAKLQEVLALPDVAAQLLLGGVQ